ncbi:MAG: hypothetical protein Q4B32_08900 [Clostridia bacterium]|nr:hypothetical protein [Clostridia bacterium]
MGVTLLLTLMLMAAYFLMLYGVVGLLQDKRFFSSAPPAVKGIVGPHLFGFNRKAHLMHLTVYLPVGAGLAWVAAMV